MRLRKIILNFLFACLIPGYASLTLFAQDKQTFGALLDDLESDKVAVRNEAEIRLLKLLETSKQKGVDIGPQIKQLEAITLKEKHQDRGARARIILSALRRGRWDTPTSHLLRQKRAVQILERIGSEDAKEILKSIESLDAFEALYRLSKNHKVILEK